MSKIAIGVDIGGTGIKTAPVDVISGELLEERHRVLTPKPATPEAVCDVVAESIDRFSPSADTPIGVAFPGVVQQGVVRTAANMDPAWVDVDMVAYIRERSGHTVHGLNDADAAGLAESLFGAAKGNPGSVFIATLGTGIGTALVVNGHIVPNLEFGHLTIDGVDAEEYAAESARERHGLTWDTWIPYLQTFFDEIERLFWPDLIVVGGGVSKEHEMFLPRLNLRAPIVPAEALNGAGVIGAAVFSAQEERQLSS